MQDVCAVSSGLFSTTLEWTALVLGSLTFWNVGNSDWPEGGKYSKVRLQAGLELPVYMSHLISRCLLPGKTVPRHMFVGISFSCLTNHMTAGRCARHASFSAVAQALGKDGSVGGLVSLCCVSPGD